SRRAWSAAGPPAPWPRRAAARRKSSARHWHAGASPRIGRRRPEASRPTARGRRLRQRRPRARLRLDLVQRAADGWVRFFRRLDAPRVALRVGLGLAVAPRGLDKYGWTSTSGSSPTGGDTWLPPSHRCFPSRRTPSCGSWASWRWPWSPRSSPVWPRQGAWGAVVWLLAIAGHLVLASRLFDMAVGGPRVAVPA